MLPFRLAGIALLLVSGNVAAEGWADLDARIAKALPG